MRRDFCNHKNVTIGVPHIEAGNLFIVEEKKISGVVGPVFHKFYGLDKENFCRFIRSYSFGSKLPNGTFTGALLSLKEGKLDAWGKANTLFEYQDFLIPTSPVYENGYYTGHTFQKDVVKGEVGSLTMFEVEFSLQLVPFLGFLMTFFSLFCILPHSRLIRKSELIVASLLQLSFALLKSINAVSLIILFYGIYTMIYKSILTNNIKTNSVVVDTSQLIDSNEDLFNTRRTVCYLRIENDVQMMAQAPRGSFLNRLYEKSIQDNNGQLVFISSQAKDWTKIQFDKFLVFARSVEITGALAGVKDLLPSRLFYTSLKSHYELFDVFYFRKHIDPYFLPIALWLFEAGIFGRLKQDLIGAFSLSLANKIEIFQTKKQYTEEYSQIHIFDYNYIKDSFHLFLFSNLLIIALFFCTYLFEKTKRFALYLLNPLGK